MIQEWSNLHKKNNEYSRIKRASLDAPRRKIKNSHDGTLLRVNDRGRLLFCDVVR